MSGGDRRGWETVCFRVPPHEKALLLRIVKEQSEQMGRRVSMSEVLRYLMRATLRKEGVPYAALISNIEEEVSWQTFFWDGLQSLSHRRAPPLSCSIGGAELVQSSRSLGVASREAFQSRCDPASRQSPEEVSVDPVARTASRPRPRQRAGEARRHSSGDGHKGAEAARHSRLPATQSSDRVDPVDDQAPRQGL